MIQRVNMGFIVYPSQQETRPVAGMLTAIADNVNKKRQEKQGQIKQLPIEPFNNACLM